MQRAALRAHVQTVEPARFIFVDEMGINCGMTRRYARAERGQRAVCRVPREKGRNTIVVGTIVVGALGLRGLVAALSFQGSLDSLDSLAWRAFLEQLLVPQLQVGDIVVMDNCRVHRSAWVVPLLEAVGAHVLYLPTYSPDLSPIENYWGKIKEFLRATAARIPHALDEALTQALQTVTRQDIEGWFRHCGYEVTSN